MPPRGTILIGLALTMALASCGGGGSSAVPSPPGEGSPVAVPPTAGCEPSSQQALVAADLKFDRRCMAVPAHRATTLSLTNNDPGQSHNVSVYRWESCFAQAVRAGDPSSCKAPKEGLRYAGRVLDSGTVTYHILGFRPGRYAFICTVHPSMYGTLKAA